METHYYTCNYCMTEYLPKKRGIQKYCSPSCRVTSHKKMKKLEIKLRSTQEVENGISNSYEPTVNTADIINSAIGAGAVELSKAIFTKSENKPATKKDIQDLISKIQERYLPIVNMPLKPDGTRAFYDTVQKAVLYLPVG